MVDLTTIQKHIDDYSRFSVFKVPSQFIEKAMLSIIKTGPLPDHIGLIMDGNRRFAKQRSMQLVDGHTAGAQSLGKVSFVSIAQ